MDQAQQTRILTPVLEWFRAAQTAENAENIPDPDARKLCQQLTQTLPQARTKLLIERYRRQAEHQISAQYVPLGELMPADALGIYLYLPVID
jgi:malate synthase